ncbi:hypothetical protein LPJ61_000292 [Coemansia biformis]|uniref:ARMC9 CTLH-like domain-containing protein n=1 Tax=Coemansia biformis TaxID=1286918 RepID=A0A9W7YIM9_9FUNG|nr:hypothetical protein LPJ61_000292 [Coemansia biformis]
MADHVQSARAGIESLEYIDDLVREYLLFRGFESTLKAFEGDLGQDRDWGFDAGRIVGELLGMARELRPSELLEYWKYLTSRFFSHLSPKYHRTVKMFEKRLVRLFLVSAVSQGRRDVIRGFMSEHGRALAQQGGDWMPWLGLEYIEEPQDRPEFDAYFGPEWCASLQAALTDFVQTVFPATAVPRILLFDKDRREKEALQRKVAVYEEHLRGETKITTMPASSQTGLVEDHIGGISAAASPRVPVAGGGGGGGNGVGSSDDGVCDGRLALDVIQTDEPPSLLKIRQEDIFLEHNAGISLAKFSASGELIASYDDESVLKVWSPDPSSTAPKLKNELDYSVSAMAWDMRHTHLLYLYDEGGSIRTLNTNTNLMSRLPTSSKRHPWIQCMLASPASSTLVTVCSAKPESTADVAVRIWDASANKAVASRRLVSAVESQGVCAAINHNSNLVALAHSTGAVNLVDARTLETVATIKTRRHGLCSTAFSLDEDSLMAVSETGGLTQWSLRKHSQMLAESMLSIGAADGGSSGVSADSRLDVDRVAFTPDRESIVVAPRNQCLVFNVDSATQTDSTRRHKGLIFAVDFAADRSLSACEDGTIHVACYRKV